MHVPGGSQGVSARRSRKAPASLELKGPGDRTAAAEGARPLRSLPAGVGDENYLALAAADCVAGVAGVGDKLGTAHVRAFSIAGLAPHLLPPHPPLSVNAPSPPL